MEAMTLAAAHPEATQRIATAGTAAIHGAQRADPSGSGSVASGAKIIAGAAAVGGVAVGAAAGSMALGIVGAGAAAYAAARQGTVGDAARATGQAAVTAAGKAAEVNQRHKITDKVAAAAKRGIQATADLDRKHDISGKTAKAVTSLMNGVTRALQPKPAAGSQSDRPALN